ncbi:NusG domain II-containing protein [Loigolactobacillus zhaoyuanensis]|uniref:NusG domain II-containing protein n=1 Tax=Loigolactobacillus zhaoyuanensis TaxID=2486017 RepID=A0ABW8UDP0_9LACO|nr:NusG domain II-containing protein [Loigolactobacillus zhaoyuanensis]
MIRPWDVIIVLLLIIGSFTPLAIFALHEKNQVTPANQAQTKQVRTAIISHDGKKLYSIKLTGHKGSTKYRYRAPDGDYNVVEIKNDRIAIVDANCRDQVCVRRGWISKPGQTIVCLPHKLLIEIKVNHGSQTQGGMVTE